MLCNFLTMHRPESLLLNDSCAYFVEWIRTIERAHLYFNSNPVAGSHYQCSMDAIHYQGTQFRGSKWVNPACFIVRDKFKFNFTPTGSLNNSMFYSVHHTRSISIFFSGSYLTLVFYFQVHNCNYTQNFFRLV